MNKMKIFVNRKLHFVLLPFLRSLSFVCPAIGVRPIAVATKLEVMRVKRRAKRISMRVRMRITFQSQKIARNFLFDVFNSNSARVQSHCVITIQISNSISCQSAPFPVTRTARKKFTGNPDPILHSFVGLPTTAVGP